MRRAWILAACFAVVIACKPPCQGSSDCEPGEHCELSTGDCVEGCKSDDDCPGSARCNKNIGNCLPTVTFVTTPTTADAGATDAR